MNGPINIIYLYDFAKCFSPSKYTKQFLPTYLCLNMWEENKVKQSHYRPGVAQRVPESQGSPIT